MSLNFENIKKYITNNNLAIKGILHIGAYDEEVKKMYNELNIHDNNIIWVDSESTDNGMVYTMSNLFRLTIDETSPAYIYNNRLNNNNCILECCKDSPKIYVNELNNIKTQSLKEFINYNNLDPADYNFWNFDSIGINLKIFQGAQEYLKYVDIVYTDINSTNLSQQNSDKRALDSLLKNNGLIAIDDIKEGKWWEFQMYKSLYIRM